jgi:hypothetical protein
MNSNLSLIILSNTNFCCDLPLTKLEHIILTNPRGWFPWLKEYSKMSREYSENENRRDSLICHFLACNFVMYVWPCRYIYVCVCMCMYVHIGVSNKI